MNHTNIRLIDLSRNIVATGAVTARDGSFTGQIDLGPAPAPLRRLFEEYEEIVNGQMFSLLDEIEDRIAAVPLKVVFDEGQEAAVRDLQVYPTTGRVSFKVVEPASATPKPGA
jgi:hypothetical protein